MRRSFSNDYRFSKPRQIDNREYQFDVLLTAPPNLTLDYSDENVPAPPDVPGVTWITSFLVTGPAASYTLAVSAAAGMPPGRADIVVYCQEDTGWTERPKGAGGKWVLPTGDPAIGIR